jgi:death on curing protein
VVSTKGQKDDRSGTEIRYLTLREVLSIHEETMKSSGGSRGILTIGNVEFALDFIQIQPFSMSINDLFMKCAILGRAIIQGHPFIDGNKRTGIEVIDYFLNKNGYTLRTDVSTGIIFTIEVATGSLRLEEIADWIRSHSEKSINNELMVEEPEVKYMIEQKSDDHRKKRENPYGIPDESLAMIRASIKRNKKLLEELAKY